MDLNNETLQYFKASYATVGDIKRTNARNHRTQNKVQIITRERFQIRPVFACNFFLNRIKTLVFIMKDQSLFWFLKCYHKGTGIKTFEIEKAKTK